MDDGRIHYRERVTMKKDLGTSGVHFYKVMRKIFEKATNNAVMEGYVCQHKELTGEDITPREVLKECGFNDVEIAEYYKRNGIKES